jgi:HEAT repeat protein
MRALEDASTDNDTRSDAAIALASLTWDNANNAAIPHLVELLRGGSVNGRTNAAAALRGLTISDDDAIKAAIVAAGAIPLLVELLRGGLVEGREYAAGVLGNLAHDNAIAAAVAEAGAIPLLVELLRGGSDKGRSRLHQLHQQAEAGPEAGQRLARPACWWSCCETAQTRARRTPSGRCCTLRALTTTLRRSCGACLQYDITV